MSKQELVDGLNDVSNEIYHSDRKYLSSSVLKVLYKDLAEYKRQYIDGIKQTFGNENALSEGSLTHAYILEPHNVPNDFIFFPGLRKAGADWEAFKASLPETRSKTIISKPQKIRVDSYLDAYRARPEAVQMISGGFAEQTICGELFGVPIKVRFDYINVERGEIYDVKTTGDFATPEAFKETIKKYSYQLSAALYCAMAEKFYGKPFKFFFIAISKQHPPICEVYKASEATMAEGLRMVRVACEKYLVAKQTNIWTEPLTDGVKSDILKVSSYQILEV